MSTFQHFLNRVIHINENQFRNKTFFNFLSTLEHTYDNTIIVNCKFYGIISFHVKGGAILAVGHLNIRNSEFLKCSSQGYGIIASFSSIHVENTIFYKNIALFTSSIFSDSKDCEPFHIEGNSFSKCKSKICLGIIYRPSPSNDFKYAYNNFSSSIVKGDYGSIIVNKSKTDFSYSIISNIQDSKLNCGIYIDINYFTKIESCIFCNLSRTSIDSNFGIALQIMMSEKPSVINNCIFGKMDTLSPILFCSLNNILISNSCFYQKREEIELLPFFEFVNCTYDKSCSIVNRICLLTYIEDKDDIQTNIISFTHDPKELRYELYLHFPFLLALFIMTLCFL